MLFACVATVDQKGSEMDCKPVTATFALTNTISSEATIDRVTIDGPKDSEGAGPRETLHSPTTGQIQSVSVY